MTPEEANERWQQVGDLVRDLLLLAPQEPMAVAKKTYAIARNAECVLVIGVGRIGDALIETVESFDSNAHVQDISEAPPADG